MNDLKEALETLDLSPKLAPLIWNRGITDSDKLTSFFYPSLSDLNDPLQLFDMEKAIERIQKAVEEGQKIVIYGDYDADGITSTTVMKEAIELIGGDVDYYLPNRFEDGYGPNLGVYKRLITEMDVQLIITVDNGVSGHEAIAYAQESGVDVIVTDHHELPETLPNAYAIIHPRHPEGAYPFRDLAGVGVAFKVATALLGEVPAESLDLVAIGTVADLVSLTDENRALVSLGLDVLRQSERVGLHALASVSNIDMVEMTEESIGFTLAPRLNAIGRLGDASPGVELLSTFDEDEASQIARFIQEKNSERQEIVKKITQEALDMVRTTPDVPVHILMGDGWHEGVLGIVASRIVQETNKPTIVLGLNPETGIAKGSGRSIASVDLFNMLSSVSKYLLTFGGHHMAAGLSFNRENLTQVETGVFNYLEASGIDLGAKEELLVDGQLEIVDIDVPYIEMLRRLAPFGTDNPVPLFEVKPDAIRQLKRIGVDGTHLKCQLVSNDTMLDCIAFNKGKELIEFETSHQVDMVGQLSINEWNGFRKPQLMLKDYQIDDLQVFDLRGKKGIEILPSLSRPTYLLFDESNIGFIEDQTADIFIAPRLTDEDVHKLSQKEDVILVDCPYDMTLVTSLLSQLLSQRLYIQAKVKEEHYLTGLPTRDQFGKLFKMIASQSSIDIRYKLNELSTFLKIDKNQLIFMINVFFELGFVTIDDGLMKRVDNPISRPLSESKEYQSFSHKSEMEKLFLYSDIKEIKHWISQQEEMK